MKESPWCPGVESGGSTAPRRLQTGGNRRRPRALLRSQRPAAVGTLRAGPEKAVKALIEMPFLSQGGPGREEMHAMYELLCKNRNPEPGEAEIDGAAPLSMLHLP